MTYWLFSPISTITNPRSLVSFNSSGDVLNLLTIIFLSFVYYLKKEVSDGLLIKLLAGFLLFTSFLAMVINDGNSEPEYEEVNGMKIPKMKDFKISLTID